ncbi:MAG TPA: DUF3140 domain-containing protein [Terricaulis sp.]|nr:DUF3140 domain-containing protein [Terricaulis sp.]
MPRASDEDVRARFAELVNMSARQIAAWHKGEQSRSVGQDSGDGVSVGVKAGQRTVQLLRAKRAPNADDIKHMRRVIGFIARLRAQSPRKNRETSRWRYALMNWGHDPLADHDRDSPWL